MCDFLCSPFQQHIDVWINTIVTVLPTVGVVLCLLYQRTSLRDSRQKELQHFEKLKQKVPLLPSKEIVESIQKYERFWLNDPRAAHIYLLDSLIARYDSDWARSFTTLEPHTLQERSGASPFSNGSTLPELDDPLPVSNTPSDLPGITNVPLLADVLLVTVTEIETNAILQVFQERCQHGYERHYIGSKTYYELGVVNGARIFLVQSEMGVGGTGSSLLTVYEGVRALRPSNVIMVGIAFGVDPAKQRIGDILVSQQLHGYHLQRYGTDDDGTPSIISRGDRVTASAKLLDRFRSGSLDWPGRRGRWGKRVYFGTILSGETLVDNIDYRDQLRTLEPEAIGGEMEGVGLYTAAQNAKVDWILVKAICDWADGNKSGEKTASSGNEKSGTKKLKDQNQLRAAKNAALFTLYVLDTTRLV